MTEPSPPAARKLRSSRPWTEWIAWVLEEAGYTVRIQAWDFAAGANFVLEMDMATRISQRTIAVLSPALAPALGPHRSGIASGHPPLLGARVSRRHRLLPHSYVLQRLGGHRHARPPKEAG